MYSSHLPGGSHFEIESTGRSCLTAPPGPFHPGPFHREPGRDSDSARTLSFQNYPIPPPVSLLKWEESSHRMTRTPHQATGAAERREGQTRRCTGRPPRRPASLLRWDCRFKLKRLRPRDRRRNHRHNNHTDSKCAHPRSILLDFPGFTTRPISVKYSRPSLRVGAAIRR